ncbi:hypothetical protein TIFTF001_017807 [Ficus carica]|uniref:SWIM-type domain-containing protein n=1 Tax=Ficus carica TaxID=3494 RepID=A0AA88AUV7_FICCA|nr:hypothetical protein TIFTF001_017807 [Ficus carica]
MQAEFGVSFNYLRAWRGKEAALTSLRGDDAESYNVLPAWAEMVKRKNPASDIHIETDSGNCLQYFYMCLATSKHANLVYPDAVFGICVQHLTANLKTRYKDFKSPLNTYFDGRSYKVLASILQWMEPRPADQFDYAITNNAGQIWIVDISEETCTCRLFQVDQIHCPHAMAVCNHRRIDPYNYCSNYYTKDYLYACYSSVVHPIGSAEGWDVPKEVRSQIVNPPNTKRGPSRPRVCRILSQGEEHEPIRCGRCNGYEHNRQTCTNSVPLRVHPTTRSQQSFTTPSS